MLLETANTYWEQCKMIKEVDQFKNYMLNHGKSEITVRNTVPDVKEFLSIMEIDSTEKIVDLTPLDIEDYLSEIRENGCSDNTRKTKVARVRMFFNFLFTQNIIQKNIMVGQRIKFGIPEIIDFPHSDVVKILNQCEDIELYTILHTLMGTGMRISELIKLRCDKILKDNRLQVFGKGDKWRPIECPSEVTRVLFDYIEKTKDIRGKSQYVFVTKTGNKMDASNIRKDLKKKAESAKIDNWESFSPHKVRHMYGDYCLNELHIPIDVVSKNLGHADVAITSKIYARTNGERIREYIGGINENTFFGRKEHSFDDN